MVSVSGGLFFSVKESARTVAPGTGCPVAASITRPFSRASWVFGAGIGAGVGLWARTPVNITANAITTTAVTSHAGDSVRWLDLEPSTR